MKDDGLYLTHIRDCIERIAEYTIEGRASLFEDKKTQDAVLRNLQTLAESTTRLSDSSKQHHSEIDWRKIASFRNVVVHDYLGLELDIIWQIVEQDLPLLRRTVDSMLAELGAP